MLTVYIYNWLNDKIWYPLNSNEERPQMMLISRRWGHVASHASQRYCREDEHMRVMTAYSAFD